MHRNQTGRHRVWKQMNYWKKGNEIFRVADTRTYSFKEIKKKGKKEDILKDRWKRNEKRMSGNIRVCEIDKGNLLTRNSRNWLRYETFYYLWVCREEENLVFWFGAQFISRLNFTQSERLILFSPDFHFRLAKRVSGQTHSLWLETATRTDVPLAVPAWRCFLT